MADKKIFDEELMSDEELEQVAGGSPQEIVEDNKFLNVLLEGTKYRQCKRYGEDRGMARWEVQVAWASIGIDMCPSTQSDNLYYLHDQQISREEAWAYAEKRVGKHLNRSDWDW